MVATSKVEALEAEAAKLRRDLITTMEEANKTKEKAMTLANKLRVKKQITLQKNEQLQAANQKVKLVDAKAI